MVASIAYLFVGETVNPMAGLAETVQIIPSALAAAIGATAFWLVATFIFGRIYCSSVCPVGTLQDSATWLRRRILKRMERRGATGRGAWLHPFGYARAGRVRGFVLLVYVVLLLVGITSLATVVEPWNMFRSAARATNPEANAEWLVFAGNATYGAVFGLAVLAGVWIWALFQGRGFCTEVCPIGTVLGEISDRAIYHIEIDPDKCVNCMKCEEVCKTRGIKVVSRYVDNARCVRWFDCLKVCSDDAIHYQRNRNRRATPLFRRRVRT